MYNNVGAKIKGLAETLCVLGIIAFIIIGLGEFQSSVASGIFCMLLGSLGSWLFFMCLYGFGELIDATVANRAVNECILNLLESQQNVSNDKNQ